MTKRKNPKQLFNKAVHQTNHTVRVYTDLVERIKPLFERFPTDNVYFSLSFFGTGTYCSLTYDNCLPHDFHCEAERCGLTVQVQPHGYGSGEWVLIKLRE